MKKQITLLIAAALAIIFVLGLSITAFGANLVINGSFEEPAVTDSSLLPASEVTGWNLSKGSKIEVQNGISGLAKSGNQYVQLHSNEPTSIHQYIPTSPGSSYIVSFSFSPRPGSDRTANRVRVSCGDEYQEPSATGIGAATTRWLTYRFMFQADSGTSMLKLEDMGTSNAPGGLVDDVIVEELNMCPQVEAGASAIISEASSFNGTASFIDNNQDQWQVAVNYGDGSPAENINPGTDKTIGLSHVYTDNGLYIVSVSVTDSKGAVGTDTLQVIVNNVAPVVEIQPGASITQLSYNGRGTFTDPGDDTWTALVDYGDGIISPLPLDTDNSFNLNHEYSLAGDYQVTVKVTDKDGGVGQASFVVSIADPTITVLIDVKPGSSNPVSLNGNGVIPIAISGSSSFDPGKIIPSTIMFEGMRVKATGKTNKLLAHLEDVTGPDGVPDGYKDLVIQIADLKLSLPVGLKTGTLTGILYDGTLIKGTDQLLLK